MALKRRDTVHLTDWCRWLIPRLWTSNRKSAGTNRRWHSWYVVQSIVCRSPATDPCPPNQITSVFSWFSRSLRCAHHSRMSVTQPSKRRRWSLIALPHRRRVNERKWCTLVIYTPTLAIRNRWRRRSLCYRYTAGPGAWTVGRPTLHGGPVRLRPVRATPCLCGPSMKVARLMSAVASTDARLAAVHFPPFHPGIITSNQ